MKFRHILSAVVLTCLFAGCGGAPAPSPKVHELGEVEVTARLTDVRGVFPPNDLYDYAYVMQYEVLQVHRGEVAPGPLLVGHYNPLKPRASAADARSGEIGGNVTAFNVGDVHRMALSAPLEEQIMAGIINEYQEEGKEQTLYWAWWTDQADS